MERLLSRIVQQILPSWHPHPARNPWHPRVIRWTHHLCRLAGGTLASNGTSRVPFKNNCQLLKQLYEVSQSAVRVNGELASWFASMTGVWQGFILSPQLLNIVLELNLILSIQEEEIGIKVIWQCINNLRFADDIVLLAEYDNDLETLVTKVDTFSKKFGLTINKIKL